MCPDHYWPCRVQSSVMRLLLPQPSYEPSQRLRVPHGGPLRFEALLGQDLGDLPQAPTLGHELPDPCHDGLLGLVFHQLLVLGAVSDGRGSVGEPSGVSRRLATVSKTTSATMLLVGGSLVLAEV